MYQDSQYTEPPTVQGLCGRAWLARQRPPGRREQPDHDATLAVWVVQVVGVHPVWDHWAATCIHLRPIPGVRDAKKQFPNATHEFMFAALNPESKLPNLDEVNFDWLTPIDVIEQVELLDDARAYDVLELAVRMMVNGVASPDQDWRPWWHEMFRDTAQRLNQTPIQRQ